MNYTLVKRSSNRKTGPIPVTYTSKDSCPDACRLKGNGCYAESGPVRLQWNRTMSWEAYDRVGLYTFIKSIRKGQLWRHNVAGDLPGYGDEIDHTELSFVIAANKGRRGFTYTHKPVLGANEFKRGNREAIARANREGFTINLSADDPAHADQLAELEIGPVVVLLPSGAPDRMTTPAGRKIVACPAETRGVTCDICGVCQIADRKSIIGFRAHGTSVKKANRIAMQEVA